MRLSVATLESTLWPSGCYQQDYFWLVLGHLYFYFYFFIFSFNDLSLGPLVGSRSDPDALRALRRGLTTLATIVLLANSYKTRRTVEGNA